MSGTTPISIASSTKWLTAATFMTFVDRHAIGLDDDIAKWLPEFAGSSPPITPRQLLDHTSGVHDNPCQTNGTALATCVRTLASSPREFAAGSAFSYGNSPFLVVGRLIEVLGGADFATVVHQQLTGPLAMNDTTWPGAPSAASPAFGVRVTVDDYGKLLDMILHDGVVNGTRVLSSNAVRQMISNQVAAYDTTHDYSVGITQIPRYGLGCWPDVAGPGRDDRGRERQRRRGLLPVGRLHDAHVGHRRRAGRTRRAVRGARVADGRDRGADRRRPVNGRTHSLRQNALVETRIVAYDAFRTRELSDRSGTPRRPDAAARRVVAQGAGCPRPRRSAWTASIESAASAVLSSR